MFTRKDIIKIIVTVLIIIAATIALVWLIVEIAPILIGAIVFLPWLGAALKDGAKLMIK